MPVSTLAGTQSRWRAQALASAPLYTHGWLRLVSSTALKISRVPASGCATIDACEAGHLLDPRVPARTTRPPRPLARPGGDPYRRGDLLGTEDRDIPPAGQRFMAERAKRIRMELLRKPPEELAGVPGLPAPAVRTIVRILHRQELSRPRLRKRPRGSYLRWQRPAPVQLWQVDIVGGLAMVDPRTAYRRAVGGQGGRQR
jgi:hypothetical protein